MQRYYCRNSSLRYKGILNFTTIPLNVPSWVYLEEYNMITSIEKVAYFVKENKVWFCTRIFRGFEELSGIKNPVVTTGSFDGVHIGHKRY